MKDIAILVSTESFLPEAHAYFAQLLHCGFTVELVKIKNYAPDEYRATIAFLGFFPFWKGTTPVFIGEYHSKSCGSFRRSKDILKRLLNKRPDFYIVLNSYVANGLAANGIPQLERPMGHGVSLRADNCPKEFDIVYAGSYRRGLESVIEKLSEEELRILLIGDLHHLQFENVRCVGVLSNSDALRAMASASAGLNYVPNIRPYSYQDCTKLIEYCALGLKVLTSWTPWVHEFTQARAARFALLEDDESVTYREALKKSLPPPNVDDLYWPSLLTRIGFENWVSEYLPK